MEKSIIPSIRAQAGSYARPRPPVPARKSREEKAGPRTDDGHHYAYARLSDPEDVAARIAESWDQEFAARGGTRRDFAAGARSRLSHWAAATDRETARMTYERRFRDEVALRVSARLEAWVRAGGSGPAAALETPGAAPRTC